MLSPHLRVRKAAGTGTKVILRDVVGKAIARQKKTIAGLRRKGADLSAVRQLRAAEKLVQHMLPGAMACFFRAEHTGRHQSLGYRMIDRQLIDLLSANQVSAA